MKYFVGMAVNSKLVLRDYLPEAQVSPIDTFRSCNRLIQQLAMAEHQYNMHQLTAEARAAQLQAAQEAANPAAPLPTRAARPTPLPPRPPSHIRISEAAACPPQWQPPTRRSSSQPENWQPRYPSQSALPHYYPQPAPPPLRPVSPPFVPVATPVMVAENQATEVAPSHCFAPTVIASVACSVMMILVGGAYYVWKKLIGLN